MANADAALTLMKMALALLDDGGDGCSLTACKLRDAIDEAAGVSPMREGEELDPLVEKGFWEHLKSQHG